ESRDRHDRRPGRTSAGPRRSCGESPHPRRPNVPPPTRALASVARFQRASGAEGPGILAGFYAALKRRSTRSGDDRRLLLEFLRLEVGDERVDHELNAAVHELRKLVHGQADAVVGHAVLREVISADLLAAVAAAHHRLALLGQRLLLLLLLHLVQAGTQYAHSFLAVL